MTYITGIRLKNFARFRGEHEVSPLEPKSYAIVARDAEDDSRSNYLGKTSLTVALRYCLYGELPIEDYAKIDDAISHGEDEMFVDVELSDGSYISRERKRGKWTKLKIVGVRHDIESGEPTRTEFNQERAQEEIVKLVGLDLGNYDMCADIAQKTSDRFSKMKSTELTDVVNGWVGLDQLVEAEDLAAKGLGSLTRELSVLDDQITKLSWATEAEGTERNLLLKVAREQQTEQVKFAEVHNAVIASHDRWVWHAKCAVEADTLRSYVAEMDAEIAAAPSPVGTEIRALDEKVATATAELRVSNLQVTRLQALTIGSFDGVCPVLPGFNCPAKKTINTSRGQSNEALAAAKKEHDAKLTEQDSLIKQSQRLKVQFDDQTARRARRRSAEEKAEGFKESVDYIAQHGQPPEIAPEPVTVDTFAVSLAQNAYQVWLAARPGLLAAEDARPKLVRRIAAFRVAVLALEQAQRRLCEGVVQRIEQGANRRLEAAGVDLRCSWLWGRETGKLATRCGQCGAEFPTSARVKQCQACGFPRGHRVEPKLHVRFSARSGGTKDLGGVAITLSAGEWVRRRRGSDWGVVVLDEPFASLDTAHRRALSGHLQRMVSDGVEQAFVIAHSRDVLESLPGRIEVVGRGEWSEVRVVA